MTIILKPNRLLKQFFGNSAVTVELSDKADLHDLFTEIDSRWGGVLPVSIWDRQKIRFRGPVIMKSGGSILKDSSTTLRDQQEIEIHKVLVGG